MVSAKLFIPLLLLASACLVSSFTARRQQTLWNIDDKVKANGGAFLLDTDLTVKDYMAVDVVMKEMNKGKDKWTLCQDKPEDFAKCYCAGWVAVANNKVDYNFVFKMFKNGDKKTPVNMMLQASSGTDLKTFTFVKFEEFGAPYECRDPSIPEEKKTWGRFRGFSNLIVDNKDPEGLSGLNLKERCYEKIREVTKKDYQWIVPYKKTSTQDMGEIKKSVDAKNVVAVWNKLADPTIYWFILGLKEGNVESNHLCVVSLTKFVYAKLAGDASDLSRIPSPNAKKK